MDLAGKKVTLHDMSLRDGMHAKQHQITVEQMVSIATGLDEAGMPLSLKSPTETGWGANRSITAFLHTAMRTTSAQ